MAITVNSGPTISSGNTNPVQNTEPDAGPSLSFQGSGMIDPRYVGNIGAAPGTKIYGTFTNSYVVNADGVPVTKGAARIAAAAAPTAATAMTLVTAQAAGVSPAMPILPMGAQPIAANLVSGIVMDFGFTVANTASSTTLTIPAGAWRYFYKGQRIAVAGGNGTSAAPLFTTVAVAPLPNATTLTMADAAAASVNGCQVGTAHPTLNAAWPFAIAGAVALFDANQGLTRAVSITGNSGSTQNVVTVKGYDIYGQPMSEAITALTGATTNGKKAFKVITSVTPATTDAGHTLSVGTTDILGFNFRTDYWEYNDVFVAGGFITANTGWLAGDATATATTTTGDPRGTYALQTASNGDGSTANWGTNNRVAIFSSLPMYNTIGANNLNYVTLYGTTQA